MTPSEQAAARGAAAQQAPWQSVHVYYAASSRPFLDQCARPLIEELTAEGLVSAYFFINYWLCGPHVRLRLKPASTPAVPEVCQRTEAAIAAFLKARPALYDMSDTMLRFYQAAAGIEKFSAAERERYFDADGQMKRQPTNTFSWEPYEPESGRYGGPAGIELAEWHFQRSTDLVLAAVRSMNLHVRSVLLGFSAQLMMVMTGTFLRGRPAQVRFLDDYHAFWHRYISAADFLPRIEYERSYESVAPMIKTRFGQISAALERAGQLPEFADRWAAHSAELRERVTTLAKRGELTFLTWDGTGQETITDPGRAQRQLLTSYLHMTNNRLQCTIRDEAFLSYWMSRALQESGANGSA